MKLTLAECTTEAQTLTWYRQEYPKKQAEVVYWSAKAHGYRRRYNLWFAISTLQGLISLAGGLWAAWKMGWLR